MIYFSHRVNVDVVFLKKKSEKNKNYLNKKTKNTKKYNQNDFKLLHHQFYSITKQLRENKYFFYKEGTKTLPLYKSGEQIKTNLRRPLSFFLHCHHFSLKWTHLFLQYSFLSPVNSRLTKSFTPPVAESHQHNPLPMF